MSNNLVEVKSIYDTNNEKYAFWFGIFMILLVAMTNGEAQYINTFFVGLSLIGVLIMPLAFSMSLVAGTVIYLGYSYIGLENYLPYIQSAHTYQTFLYIFLAIRIVLGEDKTFFKGIKKTVLIFLAYVFLSYLRTSVFIALREVSMILVSVWLVYSVCENKKYHKQFMLAFIVILLTVFVYNYLYSDVFEKDVDALGRFAGVRDANNFAFFCNLSLVFILFFDAVKKRKLLIGALVVGCVITISISGLVVMVSIFSIYFVIKKGFRHAFVFLLAVVLVMILLGPITRMLDAMNISAIDGYIHRLTNITSSLADGNYNEVTTDRTWLWEYYMDEYDSFSLRKQFFGTPYASVEILSEEQVLASHNSWIDMLFNYGVVGVVVMIGCIVEYLVYYIRTKRVYMASIVLIFVIHAFFRTLSGLSLFFPVFL